MLKVLWIDDIPSDSFVDDARLEKIDIEVATCVNDAKAKINEKSKLWDAIIVDVNCKVSNDDGNENIGAFTAFQNFIVEYQTLNPVIPWFVYTGGDYDGANLLPDLVVKERPWDDRPYYKKPGDIGDLFKKIKELDVDVARIEMEFRDLLSEINNEDLLSKVLDVLKYLKKENHYDKACYNQVRGVLEDVVNIFINKNILPENYGDNRFSLNNLSLVLNRAKDRDDEKSDILPIYISQIFNSLTKIVQNGSHSLVVTRDTNTKDAPYLVRTVVYELLNIIVWYNAIVNSDERTRQLTYRLGPIISELLNNNQKIKNFQTNQMEGIVEQDEEGHYFCGECFIYQPIGVKFLGKMVVCVYSENTNMGTKSKYKYFATRVEEK